MSTYLKGCALYTLVFATTHMSGLALALVCACSCGEVGKEVWKIMEVCPIREFQWALRQALLGRGGHSRSPSPRPSQSDFGLDVSAARSSNESCLNERCSPGTGLEFADQASRHFQLRCMAATLVHSIRISSDWRCVIVALVMVWALAGLWVNLSLSFTGSASSHVTPFRWAPPHSASHYRCRHALSFRLTIRLSLLAVELLL